MKAPFPTPLRRQWWTVVLPLTWILSSAPGGSHTAAGAEPPALFVRACAPCHGKDGKATTPQARKLGVKDMTKSALSEEQIKQQILDGKKGPDGTLKMPAFKDTLKDEEIERLARYAKSLQAPPKTTPPPASK